MQKKREKEEREREKESERVRQRERKAKAAAMWSPRTQNVELRKLRGSGRKKTTCFAKVTERRILRREGNFTGGAE